MKTNLRERLTGYQCFIRPNVHFAPEFSFNCNNLITLLNSMFSKSKQKRQYVFILCPTVSRSFKNHSNELIKKHFLLSMLKTVA